MNNQLIFLISDRLFTVQDSKTILKKAHWRNDEQLWAYISQ